MLNPPWDYWYAAFLSACKKQQDQIVKVFPKHHGQSFLLGQQQSRKIWGFPPKLHMLLSILLHESKERLNMSLQHQFFIAYICKALGMEFGLDA